MHLMVSFNQLI